MKRIMKTKVWEKVFHCQVMDAETAILLNIYINARALPKELQKLFYQALLRSRILMNREDKKRFRKGKK